MQYRTDDLSILGFGCMRFPRKGPGYDMKEIERQVLHAIDQGINYFDTAYTYLGNEEALGTVLANNNCRHKIKIATKLPHYLIKTPDQLDVFFNRQLQRLQTDYIDYYLMHMLPDTAVWNRLKNLGIIQWIEDKKASGQIKKIGFSYHGNSTAFQELIDSYPWEFCQIQYNYMDEHSQAGKEGLQYAASKGIPVIIMEPLRGGKLATRLPKKAMRLINSYPNHHQDTENLSADKRKRSAAEWALRWLWNQPEVSVILSGMNSMQMLDENIRIANEVRFNAFTETDLLLIDQLKDALNERIKTGCTGCSYCMPCPNGVDIPGALRCYDASYIDNYYTGIKEYVMCTTLRNKKSTASLCIECGKCEKHCPQGIEIRKQLRAVRRRLEGFPYQVGTFFLNRRFKMKE